MSTDLAPQRIVMVDDDRAFLDLVSNWLREAGYEVTALSQFAEARRYLAEHTPHVLISAVRLGAFNGLHLVVFTKMEHPETLAIVLTGYDDPVLRDEAEKSGAHYVLKPVTASDLLNRLKPPA